nr:MAG TPA: hypothetical protein [Caudoviricetes sp.]
MIRISPAAAWVMAAIAISQQGGPSSAPYIL